MSPPCSPLHRDFSPFTKDMCSEEKIKPNYFRDFSILFLKHLNPE